MPHHAQATLACKVLYLLCYSNVADVTSCHACDSCTFNAVMSDREKGRERGGGKFDLCPALIGICALTSRQTHKIGPD